MSDLLKKIEFENNSLLNRAQSNTLQKIASHFKIPQKLLRADLDLTALEQNVLKFPQFKHMFLDEFYPIQQKFKGADLLNSKKFLQSDLYAQLLAADADATKVLLAESVPWAMVNFRRVSHMQGVGGIYLNYRELGCFLVTPLTDYLRLLYPLPQEG